MSEPAFWHSTEIDKIAAALSKAQGAMESASKSAINPHLKSKYADLAAVMEACRKPLSDNEIAIVQCPAATETELSMVTLLVHASGQFFASRLTMTPRDNSPQSAGAAITYARRYSLTSMAGIAPDDDDDGHSASATAPVRPGPPPRAPQPMRTAALLSGSFNSPTLPPPAPEGITQANTAPTLPWPDRPAMEAAFADLRATVGDQHYFYVLQVHGVSPDLKGKTGKIAEAYSVLRLRATEIATGVPV